MLNFAPGALAGIPLQGGDTQLGESWIRTVQWGRSGSLPRKPFLRYGFTLFTRSSRGPSGKETQHTLFPKLIVQLGLPIFLTLMCLCIRPRGVGLQACFAQGVCLWVTLNYRHNSKNCMYIASMVKFLGDIS